MRLRTLTPSLGGVASASWQREHLSAATFAATRGSSSFLAPKGLHGQICPCKAGCFTEQEAVKAQLVPFCLPNSALTIFCSALCGHKGDISVQSRPLPGLVPKACFKAWSPRRALTEMWCFLFSVSVYLTPADFMLSMLSLSLGGCLDKIAACDRWLPWSRDQCNSAAFGRLFGPIAESIMLECKKTNMDYPLGLA